jgi:hypothetical protein
VDERLLHGHLVRASRQAVACGQACEIELMCARNGDSKSTVLNHLVHRCITCMQQPEQQCSHMFVEASPISVNGKRCYFLQHALQHVFGFTQLTQNEPTTAATTWYVKPLPRPPRPLALLHRYHQQQ